MNGRDHKYGFGGKEEQNELGLEWMDFHARNYDASLGRWMNIDPLAEKFYSWSPFNSVYNSLLKFVDPTGMGAEDIIFILDKEAAIDNGHIAVLVGSEKTGWTYISMNGTGDGQRAFGKSKNPGVQ